MRQKVEEELKHMEEEDIIRPAKNLTGGGAQVKWQG